MDDFYPQFLELLAQKPWPIEAAVEALADLYCRSVGYTTEDINDGDCHDFACNLRMLVDDGEVYWDDEIQQGASRGYHAFLLYEGRYYDAELPQGADNWWELPFYARYEQKHGRSLIIEHVHP